MAQSEEMMFAIRYVTVDVFTATSFGGNPLAVVLDARDLSDALMQRISTEFNYSETTFILPPDAPDNTARVRIFIQQEKCHLPVIPMLALRLLLGREGKLY